jgi:hypothetical protein
MGKGYNEMNIMPLPVAKIGEWTIQTSISSEGVVLVTGIHETGLASIERFFTSQDMAANFIEYLGDQRLDMSPLDKGE